VTKTDRNQELSERQKKAIPFLVQSPTVEDGCKAAKISRETYYQWLANPLFKDELKRQRDQVIEDALNVMKANITKAVNALLGLLNTKNENLRRFVCNDIISCVLKTIELSEFEERLRAVERIVLEHRTYKKER